MTGKTKERVCVAQIGAAHGLKGDVRVWSFTEDPQAFAHYGPLESEDRKQRFTIESSRAANDHFVVKLAGINDREAAEALNKTMLYVARDQLPQTEDDETFYHADLIGLLAVTPNGDAFGEVIAVHNFGAGDILEIRLPDRTTTLLAFTDRVAPKIDLAAKTMVIDPPAEVTADEAETS